MGRKFEEYLPSAGEEWSPEAPELDFLPPRAGPDLRLVSTSSRSLILYLL